MAENDQERTERPTQKRLEEAREKARCRAPSSSAPPRWCSPAAGSLHFLGGSLGGTLLRDHARPA